MAEKHRFVEMTSSGAITTRPDMKKKKNKGQKNNPLPCPLFSVITPLCSALSLTYTAHGKCDTAQRIVSFHLICTRRRFWSDKARRAG